MVKWGLQSISTRVCIRNIRFFNLTENLAERFPSELRIPPSELGEMVENSQSQKCDGRFPIWKFPIWKIWREIPHLKNSQSENMTGKFPIWKSDGNVSARFSVRFRGESSLREWSFCVKVNNANLCFFEPELSSWELTDLETANEEYRSLYTKCCLYDCYSLTELWKRIPGFGGFLGTCAARARTFQLAWWCAMGARSVWAGGTCTALNCQTMTFARPVIRPRTLARLANPTRLGTHRHAHAP